MRSERDTIRTVYILEDDLEKRVADLLEGQGLSPHDGTGKKLARAAFIAGFTADTGEPTIVATESDVEALHEDSLCDVVSTNTDTGLVEVIHNYEL